MNEIIKKDNRGEYQDFCDFCGLEERGKIYGQVKNYEILQCQKCGLIWVNPLKYFNLENLPDKYWAEEIYLANKENQQKRFKNQLNLFFKKTKEKNVKILEVGSGLGLFLETCRKFKVDAVGCDTSPRAVNFCQRNNLQVRQGTLDNFYPNQNYDAIFAFNLIEHLEKPIKFFEESKRILKNGGYLILETPIRESLFYRLAEIIFFLSGGKFNYLGINPNGHIYQFSLKTIKKIYSKFGFRFVYQKRFNPPFKELFGKSSLFEVKWKFLFRFFLPLLWLFAKIIKGENRIFMILIKNKNGMST